MNHDAYRLAAYCFVVQLGDCQLRLRLQFGAQEAGFVVGSVHMTYPGVLVPLYQKADEVSR